MPLNYSYIPNVPQGNQQVNNTQAPIRDNFYDIYDLVGVNHINFNVSDTFGRHNIVTYIEQSTDPDTADNEMALYSKAVANDANGGELFYRYPSNGTVVQLTGLAESASPSTVSSGAALGGFWYASGTVAGGDPTEGYWQYLANSVLVQTFWTNQAILTSTSNPNPLTITFPGGTYTGGVIVPSFTQTPFNMQITQSENNPQGPGDLLGYIYGVEIISTTTAHVWYEGPFADNAQVPNFFVTVIGV